MKPMRRFILACALLTSTASCLVIPPGSFETTVVVPKAGQLLPEGSYLNSCTECDFTGPILKCRCKNNQGFYAYSGIDTYACSKRISNRDGHLSCGEPQSLPAGSYLSSCTDCSMDGNQLSCSCQKENGRKHNTRLSTTFCNKPISNQDGRLTCGEPERLPQGSYQQSCSNCTFRDGRLSCSCQNERGFSQDSSLNTDFCNKPISNQNGTLTCGTPQALPQGSYLQSCSDCSMRGSTLECACRNEQGRTQTSRLNTSYCNKPISNQNGTLTCGTPQALPPGSYQQSCSNCELFSGPTLRCDCQDEQGFARSSSLSIWSCSRPINNCNGRLQCGGC